MSWRFAAFKFLFRAELCKKSLEEAGIKLTASSVPAEETTTGMSPGSR